MRYLKKYKIFESVDTLREDLTEICYDLTDDGRFDIKIYDNNELTYLTLPSGEKPYLVGDKILFIGLSNYINKGLKHDGFSFDEVREVILRLIDYLGDRYKGCSVLSVGEYERSDINKSEIIEYNCIDILNLTIIYK